MINSIIGGDIFRSFFNIPNWLFVVLWVILYIFFSIVLPHVRFRRSITKFAVTLTKEFVCRLDKNQLLIASIKNGELNDLHEMMADIVERCFKKYGTPIIEEDRKIIRRISSFSMNDWTLSTYLYSVVRDSLLLYISIRLDQNNNYIQQEYSDFVRSIGGVKMLVLEITGEYFNKPFPELANINIGGSSMNLN